MSSRKENVSLQSKWRAATPTTWRLPRIHEEIREEYSQLVHRRSGGTSSGGFLQAEHPFTVQDILEVVTYINYSKKEEADPKGRFLVFYMVMMSSRKALTERGRPRPRERLPKERSSEERQRYEIVSKEQGALTSETPESCFVGQNSILPFFNFPLKKGLNSPSIQLEEIWKKAKLLLYFLYFS